MLNRRQFTFSSTLLTALTVLPPAVRAVAVPGEPVLYRVARGQGVVHMLGFAEATDNAWFVPKIATALDAAQVLWLETPPGSATAAAEGDAAPPPMDPELQRIFAERALDPAQDLFAVLPADVAERTQYWADDLGLSRESLVPMRPWFARISIQQAYAARKQQSAAPAERMAFPERLVTDRARDRGMSIRSEYATLADLMRFFAELSDAAQPQYLEELFDYFDRDRAGTGDAGRYGWITGQSSMVSIDQQRERTPDLYRAMHVERNAWWTGRIEAMLDAGEQAFIMVGNNHVLGPDSIPANMRRRGLAVEEL